MKTLENEIFSAKRINTQTVYGGRMHYKRTCVMTNDGHVTHDYDKNDCDGHTV